MKISELSRTTGVPVPTIKYYLREGLLPAGTPTGRNQADYGPDHARRLTLVRALIDVGGLSVAAAQTVLAAVDDPEISLFDAMGAAHTAIAGSSRVDRDSPLWHQQRAEVGAYVAELGWWVHPDSPALDDLADARAALAAMGQDDLLALLPAYFAAAEPVARAEVTAVLARGQLAAVVEGVVIGTALGEATLDAVRRLAHQHVSAELTGWAGTPAATAAAAARTQPGAAADPGHSDDTGADPANGAASAGTATDAATPPGPQAPPANPAGPH